MRDADKVFRALAHPGRRRLLDRLVKENGLSLSALCEDHDMTRQAVTEHLLVLEDANLVTAVKQGRERLHYLNPVPIYQVFDRWIRKFEVDRLRALDDLKRKVERR